jgi:nicotinamide mononucleotide adenylyltransferase
MRLQPYHLGHMEFISRMFARFRGNVWIGIGSSQYSRTARNPFTYEERRDMILNNIHDPRLRVFPVMDINSPPHWANHVLNTAKEYGLDEKVTICAGSEYDVCLFKLVQCETKVLDRKEQRYTTSGSAVRLLLEVGDGLGSVGYGMIPECNREWLSRFYATTTRLRKD